jgi:cell division protein FtsQ
VKRPEGFDAPARPAPRTPAGSPKPQSSKRTGAASTGAASTGAARTGAQQTRAQPAAKPTGARQPGAPQPGAQQTGAKPAKGAPTAAEPRARRTPAAPLGIRTPEERSADRAAPEAPITEAAGARPAKAGAPGTGGRGTKSSTARKPHPPAPRGSGARQPAGTGPGGADPEPSRRRRAGIARRGSSSESEARRAARQRRRFERGEIRRFTRRSRNRRLAWAAGVLLVLGMFGGVAAAVFSPLFALSRIDIRGTDRVAPEDVHAALEDQLGTPLALLDEGAIRAELGGFPLIRSFITELVPPHTLVIRITERQPVGALPSESGFELTDPAGVVVQRVQERPEGMPLIDVGDEVPGTAFSSAAEVLLALPDDLAARVDTVRARTKDDVTLVLTGSDQRVLWGSAEHSDSKARALAGMVAQHGDDGPGLYDVSAPMTVVFRED